MKLKFYVGVVAMKGDWPFLRKSYHLQCGFTSRRICHMCPGHAIWPHLVKFFTLICGITVLTCGSIYVQSKEWWDMSSSGQLRTWRGAAPDPYKRNKRSPFRDIPAGSDQQQIRPDLMHCFNLGFGKDLAGSGIMLLCRMEQFPGRSIGARLDAAFEEFRIWLTENKKTSSLKNFELKTFKVQTYLSS